MTTLKYNREMIKLGRQLAGLTRQALAEKCGLTQPTITRMENGDRQITDEAAIAIATALHRPLSFLTWDAEIFAPSTVFHRRRASTRVKDVEATNALINYVRLCVLRMLEGARLKTRRTMHRIDLGPSCLPADAARQLRAVWQVPSGPIPNLVELVESAGIVIWETDEVTAEVDALSLWPIGEDDSRPIVVRVAGKSGDRERLTLAHELGHLCLHHLPSNDFESEAYAFGSEFLMPEDDIMDALKDLTLQKAAALKGKWKVSMQAIIRRSRDLGVSNESAYGRLMRELSAKGYRTREPVLIPSEKPRLLDSIVTRFCQQRDKRGLTSEYLGSLPHYAVPFSKHGEAPQSQCDVKIQPNDDSGPATLRLFG